MSSHLYVPGGSWVGHEWSNTWTGQECFEKVQEREWTGRFKRLALTELSVLGAGKETLKRFQNHTHFYRWGHWGQKDEGLGLGSSQTFFSTFMILAEFIVSFKYFFYEFVFTVYPLSPPLHITLILPRWLAPWKLQPDWLVHVLVHKWWVVLTQNWAWWLPCEWCVQCLSWLDLVWRFCCSSISLFRGVAGVP